MANVWRIRHWELPPRLVARADQGPNCRLWVPAQHRTAPGPRDQPSAGRLAWPSSSASTRVRRFLASAASDWQFEPRTDVRVSFVCSRSTWVVPQTVEVAPAGQEGPRGAGQAVRHPDPGLPMRRPTWALATTRWHWT